MITRLRIEGAALPDATDFLLTEVFGGAIATIDDALPGALPKRRDDWDLDRGQQVLLILVDGLGWESLNRHYGHAATLRALRDTTYCAHTVVPSTTAAAITAFATGAQPGATRMVGYSVFDNDALMNLLAFAPDVDPCRWQEVTPHFTALTHAGVTSAVISPPAFANSGLTRAALRGARHVGAVSWEARCQAALAELREGTQVVYLYWSDIDHIGHGRGVASHEWAGALEDFDRGLLTLLRQLPSGVRAVLTADHGMVDVEQRDLVDCAHTAALREGTRVLAGETRAVHVHCEAGHADAVLRRWRDYLGERAWVVTRADLAALMGDGPGLSLVGDFVAFMRQGYGVVDSRTQSAGAISLVGVHGSLTSAEMLIPVIRLA
nr:alkaline phosphatase family protein [Schaalia suimastitidis]